jgi:tetratricopeptide (TPR) repeat protein
VNEQDKAFARKALEEKRLTIEQVQEIRAEVDRSGRPFEEVAIARGLLRAPKPAPISAPPPPAPPAPVGPRVPADRKSPLEEALEKLLPSSRFPRLYFLLLVASFVIFAGLLLLTVNKMQENSSKEQDLAVEQSKNITEAERKSAEAMRGYQRSVIEAREAHARQGLAKAREAMARVDDRMKTTSSSPDITLALNEAFVGYNTYLDVLPDDADVRIERARTHQLRRNYDLAIADLERASQLKPDRAAALRDQITQLRLLIARTPK